MIKPGVFLQNRYEIINRIGSGGMAEVYKAKDHKLNRFVAVKVLRSEYRDDKGFLSKFRVEAQAAAGLSHPNNVNVYDVGEDRGLSFIVMELVEGITLKDYIAKKGKLSVREATSICLQAAAGLEAAHNNGIVHRDVKPQNIIISLDGKAKITDFGIARAATSDTIRSSAMGSVHYSAPEQTRGGYCDAKSDIYSLGITFYEMLTGRVPFDGDTTVEVALKHLQEEIPGPRRFAPEIPHSTEQIVLKCTQKSPDRRYQNMAELIRDLKESLVNPDGDFVVIPKVDNKAKTIMFSDDEVREIRNNSLPVYDDSLDTGAAGKLQQDTRSYGRGDTKPYANYYQNSRYQPAGSAYRPDAGTSGNQREEYRDREYPSDYPPLEELDDLDDLEDENEDDYENEASRRRRRRSSRDRGDKIAVAAAIAAGVLAVLIILFIIGRMLGIIGGSGTGETDAVQNVQTEETSSKVPMPDLIGKTEKEAQKMLKDLNLGYKYLGEKASSEYAKGTVVEQSEEAGNEVDINTTIGYYISSGSIEPKKIPDLTDKPQAQAEKMLKDMGLSYQIDNTRYSDTISKGNVITTNPGAGSSVTDDNPPVTVYISQGSDSSLVEVPNMVNHYESDAQTALSNLGLYAFVTEQTSDTIDSGLVISQDVAPGTMVQTGTSITLTVSTGPADKDDITILDTEGTWMCYAQLNAPDGYNGEPVQIDLLQNGTTTTVFSGIPQFPYILNVQGQPGVTTGTVYVYTLDPTTYEVTSTTEYDGVEFSRVD